MGIGFNHFIAATGWLVVIAVWFTVSTFAYPPMGGCNSKRSEISELLRQNVAIKNMQ